MLLVVIASVYRESGVRQIERRVTALISVLTRDIIFSSDNNNPQTNHKNQWKLSGGQSSTQPVLALICPRQVRLVPVWMRGRRVVYVLASSLFKYSTVIVTIFINIFSRYFLSDTHTPPFSAQGTHRL